MQWDGRARDDADDPIGCSSETVTITSKPTFSDGESPGLLMQA